MIFSENRCTLFRIIPRLRLLDCGVRGHRFATVLTSAASASDPNASHLLEPFSPPRDTATGDHYLTPGKESARFAWCRGNVRRRIEF
jgi:hypothetical protein